MNLLSIVFYGMSLFLSDPLEQRLAGMVRKSRVVMVYCPKTSDAEFKLQKKWLSEVGKDILERDLCVIDCVESELSTQDASHLKARFNYSPDHFCFWLIGKDGEVKLISNKPVKPEHLFGIIDSMPMRREEMKKN